MARSTSEEGPPPRFWIERAADGYRVVGPDLLIWEPTLGEAVERREELELVPWRYPEGKPAAHGPVRAFESVVYGPVQSRRLGRSLGLSLTPVGKRVCTFDCVYCAYAEDNERRDGSHWPTADETRAALAEALAEVGEIDSITISGHGEPTLNPRFAEVVDSVLRTARQARRGVPVRVLTNGSETVRPEVRGALDRLDERIVKLDAGAQSVCRPARRNPLGAILLGMTLLRDVTLQCCFCEGEVSNTDEDTIRQWIQLVSEIEPRAVQIYTIDRQPARADVRPVPQAHLEEIACRLRARTGIEAQVYG